MKGVRLDARLREIVSEIEGETLADIGCDHGKVTVAALLEGRVKRAYAVDISPDSLQKAKILSEEQGVTLTPVLYDGIPELNPSPDVIVIAGVGGNEIVSILGRHAPDARYILVPHQDAPFLRGWLSERFRVERDNFVESNGKFYPVLVAVKGKTHYTERERYFGKNIPKTSAYAKFLERRKEYLKRVSVNLPERHLLRTEFEALGKDE